MYHWKEALCLSCTVAYRFLNLILHVHNQVSPGICSSSACTSLKTKTEVRESHLFFHETANGNLRVICINTGFEILKYLYFHIKAFHSIDRQEGWWPLISDQHPGDTVTRSPMPTGLPAGDHAQLVMRYLAETSAQYCCSPHTPRVMAHSWRWWFHMHEACTRDLSHGS